jgi:hypothetical protein
VCHAATSCEKPLRWALPIAIVPKFFNERPPKKRLSKAEFSFLRSPQNYQLQFFLRYSVPSSMMNVLAAVSPNSGTLLRASFEMMVHLQFTNNLHQSNRQSKKQNFIQCATKKKIRIEIICVFLPGIFSETCAKSVVFIVHIVTSLFFDCKHLIITLIFTSLFFY